MHIMISKKFNGGWSEGSVTKRLCLTLTLLITLKIIREVRGRTQKGRRDQGQMTISSPMLPSKRLGIPAIFNLVRSEAWALQYPGYMTHNGTWSKETLYLKCNNIHLRPWIVILMKGLLSLWPTYSQIQHWLF